MNGDVQRFVLRLVNGVIDGVFRHGLYDQLDSGFFQCRFIPCDGVFEFVFEAHFLNDEIVAHLLQLLPDGDLAASPADGQPEQPSQRGNHQDCLPPPAPLFHPDDGIQRIVKEMGIDLSLKGVELVEPLDLLLLHDLIHQGADAAQHPVKGL